MAGINKGGYHPNYLASIGKLAPSYDAPQQGSSYEDLVQSLQAADRSAKKATEQRYKEAKGKMEMVESIYAPGGGFAQAYSAFLGSMSDRTIAKQEQGLVSSGLSNTTSKAALQTIQSEQNKEALGKFQFAQAGQYAQALQNTAGLLERREDIGPDYGMIAQLMAKINA